LQYITNAYSLLSFCGGQIQYRFAWLGLTWGAFLHSAVSGGRSSVWSHTALCSLGFSWTPL